MIVVTGATGNVGKLLVQALARAGDQVTAVSRRGPGPEPETDVQHMQADLADPETLRPVLDGAAAMFLLAAGEDPQAIIDVAKAGGVRRIVLLSSLGAATRPAHFRHFVAFEDAVRTSGLDWTILQPGYFDSNVLAWAPTIRTQRTVAAPFGDVGLPAIDPGDIADVAAVVLHESGHAGHTYVLTGPAVTTPRERAEALGAALGEPVRFIEKAKDEARAEMLGYMPEAAVTVILAATEAPLAAEQRISPDIHRVLGRAPHTFAEWAQRNIAAFR